jgi:SAM-dependent methyltransferase
MGTLGLKLRLLRSNPVRPPLQTHVRPRRYFRSSGGTDSSPGQAATSSRGATLSISRDAGACRTDQQGDLRQSHSISGLSLSSAETYDRVFEFGCGCGRVARKLIQQRPQPRHYLGIDLHRGMISWCQRNLTPFAPHFEFRHHDVYNLGFSPSGSKAALPFPAADAEFTLVEACSVFTHVTEQEARFYLQECKRILKPDGILNASWFLFEKKNFPMMHEFSNALYVQYADPQSAVLFSREWLRKTAREYGFTIVHIVPPFLRGHQWHLVMMASSAGRAEVEFPEDRAPYGQELAAVPQRRPDEIGID